MARLACLLLMQVSCHGVYTIGSGRRETAIPCIVYKFISFMTALCLDVEVTLAYLVPSKQSRLRIFDKLPGRQAGQTNCHPLMTTW